MKNRKFAQGCRLKVQLLSPRMSASQARVKAEGLEGRPFEPAHQSQGCASEVALAFIPLGIVADVPSGDRLVLVHQD